MIHSWNYNEYWGKCEYSISNLSEFKRTKYVIQFSQYPKNPHYEKRSHQTIIFGQILVVLNLTISIKCYKQKKKHGWLQGSQFEKIKRYRAYSSSLN